MLLSAIVLTLSPWKGHLPPAATAGATAYKLAVHGQPNQEVHLRADGVPKGWIASFCTGDLCSPMLYSMQLNARGAGAIEFQAVRLDDDAVKHARVIVRSSEGGSAAVNVNP